MGRPAGRHSAQLPADLPGGDIVPRWRSLPRLSDRGIDVAGGAPRVLPRELAGHLLVALGTRFDRDPVLRRADVVTTLSEGMSRVYVEHGMRADKLVAAEQLR